MVASWQVLRMLNRLPCSALWSILPHFGQQNDRTTQVSQCCYFSTRADTDPVLRLLFRWTSEWVKLKTARAKLITRTNKCDFYQTEIHVKQDPPFREDQKDLHAHYLVADTLSGALTTTFRTWFPRGRGTDKYATDEK